MTSLLTRLREATGADRALADEVLLACGWTCKEHGNNLCDPSLIWTPPDDSDSFNDGDQPNPLASLDAALSLARTRGELWEMLLVMQNAVVEPWKDPPQTWPCIQAALIAILKARGHE